VVGHDRQQERLLVVQVLLSADQAGQHAEFLAERPVRDDHLVDVRLLDGGGGHRDLLGRVGATETPDGA